MQSAAQLANLQAPFPKGNTVNRRSAEIDRGIRGVRRAFPEAVKLCHDLIKNPGEEMSLRLRAAIAIMDKAMPGNNALLQLGGDDIVSKVTIEIQRHDREQASSESVTIEARPEQQTLQISTVPAGHGND
jgi:hypothetical protein